MAGRLAEARAAYEAARAAAPSDIRPRFSLASIDVREGALASARERLRWVVGREPGLVHAWRNLASTCQDLGLWSEALAALRRVVELAPNDAEARFAHAAALITIGRVAAGLKAYRSLAQEPALRLRALTRMGLAQPASLAQAEVEEMGRAAADAATPETLRISLDFALGAVLDLQGRFDEAFAALERGNALKRSSLATAPPGERPVNVLQAHVAAARHVASLFEGRPFDGATDEAAGAAPIFVVGMPRSGSSLIEQILASHRDVVGLGETAVLPRLLERAYPARPGEAFAQPPAQIARAYLDELRQRGWDGRLRFVDKTLENYLHVGAIRLMFPRAVILESGRHPADTAFACWRQLFTHGAESLYDLGEIAAEYVAYAALMAHWREVGAGVTEVSLESLADDPDARIRWLVTQACGLAWDPACLRFWTTERAVRTASAAQVRQPVSAAGIGRWRRYEKHLGPLIDKLGPGLHA